MAEYAGYVQRAAPIDWGMVAEDIITKLGDVEKDKAAFREKYDTMASDLYKELGDYEAGKSQSFNEFVYNGISSGRTTLAALHERLKRREISPDDFNRATMSMSSQMDDFKQLTTHYNEAIANTQKGIDDKKLSGLSVFASERLASIADFKNKNLQWMPNQNGYTNLYINSLDKNGNIVGDPTSVTSLVTPGNLEYKRTDIAEETKRFTSELGKYKKDGINDAKAREGYKKARTGIVNSIVNDANSVASILYEYGNYTFYEEGQPKPKGKSLMVKVDDNHMLVPDVDPQNYNDPAVKEAREIVENIINQQVDYEETPPKTSKSSKTTPTQQAKIDAAKTTYKYATGISMGDENIINDLISQDAKISNIEVVQVGPKSKRGITIFDNNGKVRDFISFVYDDEKKGIINHDKTGEKLARFVSKKPDLSDQQAEYKLGGDNAGRVSSGKSTSKIDTPQVAKFKQTYKRRGANLSAADYIAKFPEETSKIKEIFNDLGIPGVKVGPITTEANSYEITVEGKTYTIPKAKKDPTTTPPIIDTQANPQAVENAIQQVIDDYYGGLAMDTPEEQMQETDVIERDVTKYNVV